MRRHAKTTAVAKILTMRRRVRKGRRNAARLLSPAACSGLTKRGY